MALLYYPLSLRERAGERVRRTNASARELQTKSRPTQPVASNPRGKSLSSAREDGNPYGNVAFPEGRATPAGTPARLARARRAST